MGALSNQLLVVTIFAYVVAMMAYALEYTAARTRVRELVGAGGPAITEAAPVSRRAGVAAVVLTVLGLLAHVVMLLSRGIAAGRAPWGNMYEFVLTSTGFATLAWLVVLHRWRGLRPLGVFITLAVASLLCVAGMTLYVPAGPLVPALRSSWLVIHVGFATISSGILLVGGVTAALHLIRLGADRGRTGFPYTLRIPEAVAVERLSFRLHSFAFPIWTFTVIGGAIWAEAAWGRYWNWDPKETWSFVAWVIYAAYLHARSTPSVSRRVTSWIALTGWLAMLCNLFLVNLFAGGLHSYAGL